MGEYVPSSKCNVRAHRWSWESERATLIAEEVMRSVLLVVIVLHCFVSGVGAELPFVQVSDDGRSFVFAGSGEPFVPWGFNYDHDRDGRLIEDYWIDQWSTIEEDFREMRTLGANVVRIHLQFGKFMETAERPNERALERLARLVQLAEAVGLYLDVTGLGCYHKSDVPAWYDELDEAARWQAQANFWAAVANTCAESPAVFCYDLMNEPVVPGGNAARDDWLGPAFGDKHFVQFITLDRKGRERPDIARAWIKQLVDAVREHDRRHLVTVGLVPWSLDRPGLTSGFVPDKIAGQLDFLCVHIYPETGKVDEAIETLKGFSVGKPVVVEEMFPLRSSADELLAFIDESREHASGWIGFYWGKTPDEYRPPASIGEAVTLQWLELFQRRANDR
jgi:hypothetical protein